jgi:hypothetical protein
VQALTARFFRFAKPVAGVLRIVRETGRDSIVLVGLAKRRLRGIGGLVAGEREGVQFTVFEVPTGATASSKADNTPTSTSVLDETLALFDIAYARQAAGHYRKLPRGSLLVISATAEAAVGLEQIFFAGPPSFPASFLNLQGDWTIKAKWEDGRNADYPTAPVTLKIISKYRAALQHLGARLTVQTLGRLKTGKYAIPAWLEAGFEEFLTKDFLHLVQCHSLMHRLFSDAKPDRVLIGPSGPWSMLVASQAKRHGIESVEFRRPLWAPSCHTPKYTASAAMVPDHFLAEHYFPDQVRNGSRLLVTGNPFLALEAEPDTLDLLDRETLRARFRLPDDPVLLYCTENLGVDVTLNSMTACLDLLKRRRDLSLLVRPHPLEHRQVAGRLMREVHQRGLESRVFLSRGSLMEDLTVANLVVLLCSTVAYQALRLDKPVVIAHLADEPLAINFARAGWAAYADNREEFWRICLDVLDAGPIGEELSASRHLFLERNPDLFSLTPFANIKRASSAEECGGHTYNE